MATSPAAPPNSAVAIVPGGTSTPNTNTNTTQTIFGSHVLRINGFSGTKDLGIGESVNSSQFHLGGHVWFIRCYPCGDDEESDCWVCLFLILVDHPGPKVQVKAECIFTLMVDHVVGGTDNIDKDIELYTFSRANKACGLNFMERDKLESLLKDDCFQVRCDVFILKDIPGGVPPPPDLAAAKNVASGSHVLTVEAYSKTTGAFDVGETIKSFRFHVGWHTWFIKLYPRGEDEENAGGITANLCLHDLGHDDAANNGEVKVRFDLAVLNHADERIASVHNFCTFSARDKEKGFTFLEGTQPMSSPLFATGFHVRCDIAVVHGITAMRAPVSVNLHQSLGAALLASPAGGDVTFEVDGEVFTAHKCVLAARSTGFMAELFGPGKENTVTLMRIDEMQPRVFKALLHFIYTGCLPDDNEMYEGTDKVAMAQGLLVAADRYYMERLKLICGDMLCSYVDASTAVTTLQLAWKHGCHRLKEACLKFLNDVLADVAP